MRFLASLHGEFDKINEAQRLFEEHIKGVTVIECAELTREIIRIPREERTSSLKFQSSDRDMHGKIYTDDVSRIQKLLDHYDILQKDSPQILSILPKCTHHLYLIAYLNAA